MSAGFLDTYEKVRYLYEKNYEIRFCRTDEVECLIEFIDRYWQKNHIFTKCRELLDWQHYDRVRDRYNFVLAIERQTQEIHGVIGFIMSSIYDEKIETPIRWGAIWKVREDVGTKGLGIALKYFLEKNVPAPYVGGVGLSRFSKEINEKLEEEVGRLELYYMLNSYKKEYFLVGNYEQISFEKPGADRKEKKGFVNVSREEFQDGDKVYFSQIPSYKSPEYYVRRYFEHPIYRYHFTEIWGEDSPGACFIWRFCEHEGYRCIVIVDFLGKAEAMAGHYDNFQKLLKETGAEYISFYNIGLEEQCFYQGGFKKRSDSDIIIPVYYEPFLKQNVELDYHYIAKPGTAEEKLIFKGDADQDRPNQL